MADKCKICGSADPRLVRINRTTLVSCLNCGIYYSLEFPAADLLKKYYRHNYKITGKEDSTTEARRIFRLSEQIYITNEIIKRKPPPAALLDIGCDKGYFIDEARRWGYGVSGVELSKSGLEYCRNIGLDVYDSIENTGLNFDIITMFHALEHFADPLEQLRQVYYKLGSNGILTVRVPDFNCLWRKVLGQYWIWLLPSVHLFHFTSVSLGNILEIAGFELIDIKSQKPNNSITKKMYGISNSIMRRYAGNQRNLSAYLKQVYQNITAVELIAFARKK